MSDRNKKQDDTDVFEVFIFAILCRALVPEEHRKQKFFTRETLMSSIWGLRETFAFLGYASVVPPTGKVDRILKILIRDGKIYPIQRRGGWGTFEEHFMVAPYGVEALGKGVSDWMCHISLQ